MEYNYKKIKDIAKVYSGTTPSTSKSEYWNGSIKWITPAELQDGHNWYIYDTERKITEEAVQSKSLKMLKVGTILLTTRAPIGKVALAGETICTNQGFKNIECNTNVINPEFLYFWLLSKKKYLNSLGRGATFKEISKTIVENIQVPVPALNIQKEIVEVLKKSLFLIERRRVQIEALEQLTQSVFLEMFGDIANNPMNWETFRLDEIYEIIDGDRGKNYPKQNEFYDEGYCLFLNTGNVTKSGFNFDKTMFITKEKDEVLRKGKLERYDLILTTRGTVGNIAYYDDKVPYENVRINSGMVLLRKKADINPMFFTYYFRNPFVYKSLISGTAQPQMPISNLRNAKIFYPPQNLQSKFGDIVNKIENEKNLMKEALKQLEDNYYSLMQRAFKGELFTDKEVSNLYIREG